jgi:hypothetical protein
MLRLDKVIKPWKESAALNDHISLCGFSNETAFLTKSGDPGMVLSVPGVDYESLDHSEQEYAGKRLEAALTAFGPGFHVYQCLFKSNRPDIPFAKYDHPIVEAAIDQRGKVFEAKRDHLYQVEVFYCIQLEGTRSKTGAGTALARLLFDPEGAIAELKSQFTNDNIKTLLRTHIERDRERLDQHVRAFTRQLADFMQIEVLDQQGQFTFFRRLLNSDDRLVAGKLQSTQFLDYQVVNSDVEAERDHLRVGDYIGRALTMKEAITETRPRVLDALLKIPANFHVATGVDASPRGQGPQGSEEASPPLQYVKDGIRLSDGQRCHEEEPTRCAGGRIQTGRHRRPGRLPSCPGRRAITWRFFAHDCAVWPGVIWSLKNGTRSTRGRVHPRVHQCGRQSVCRDLQPAQRLFRHPSGQLCDRRPQAVSAEHELRRPVFSLYDPARTRISVRSIWLRSKPTTARHTF